MKTITFILLLIFSTCKLLKLPVVGGILSGYYTNLSFGSHQTPAKLMIDTGSSLTVLQCDKCTKCNDKNKAGLYSLQDSLTGRKISCNSREPVCEGKCRKNQQYCQYKILYGQGTAIQGDIINDRIFLGKELSYQFEANFGCIDLQNAKRQNGTNVMGLSPVVSENLLYSLFENKFGFQHQFATCFSQKEGYMQIGNNPQYADKPVSWKSKFYPSQTWYYLHNFENMSLGGWNITKDTITQKVLLDTGTSLYIFPQDIYMNIAEQIYARCQRLRAKCSAIRGQPNGILIAVPFNMIPSSVNSQLDKNFQTLEIIIGGVKQSIKPSQYFISIGTQANLNILRAPFSTFDSATQRFTGNNIIFGMSWLQHKRIVFDLKEQMVKAYYGQNCTYVPVTTNKDFSSIGSVGEAWEYIKTVKPVYFIIFLVILILILIIWKNRSKLMNMLSRLKECIVRKFKRTDPTRKNSNSQIQLNEQSVREEKDQDSQKQKPTVPKALKKRGKNRSVRKKKENA